MKFLALFLLALTLAFPEKTLAGEAVYYLFRHAEKTTEQNDPGLTPEGQARAQNLAVFLADQGVTRVFSTDTKRTRDTVSPLAQKLGLMIEIYDARDLAAFAGELRDMEGVIAISGHSNTTPGLASLLSGQDTEPMPESEYDRLYKIVRGTDGITTLWVLSQP